MKIAAEEAVNQLSPSINDAIGLLPDEQREKALAIALAFFSSSKTNPPKKVVAITDLAELKNFFLEESVPLINEINGLLNPLNRPPLKELIQEVIIAMKLTEWINHLGQIEAMFGLIPQSLIEEFKVDTADVLATKKVSEALARALAVVMGEARQAYVRLYHQLTLFDKEIQYAVYMVTKYHEAILDEIVWAKFELFDGPQTVTPLRRRFMRFKAKRALRKQS